MAIEMTINEFIQEAAELTGLKVYDEFEFKRDVEYQLSSGQFEWLEYEDKTIGYFGWFTKTTHEGMSVCINNLFVLKEYKESFNIFDMCKFFKERYPNIYKLEWHNQKKDCFKELILRGRKI